jgi:hypothetical protein
MLLGIGARDELEKHNISFFRLIVKAVSPFQLLRVDL